MTPLSLKKYAKDMGLCKKKNKRCTSKEGMPHASACQKKRKENKRCIPKEGMPHAQACQKKEKERKDSPLSKKKEKQRDGAYKGVPTPSTKNIHTLSHLDQGL